jgi:tetratricopeptide (TPR) repeat protein
MFALAAILLLLVPVAAQDTVTVATGRGRTNVSGRIVDYTATELRLELPGGREQTFPAQKILGIHTRYTAEQTRADALQDEGDFAAALALYRQALAKEPRRWVRRRIISQTVWCHRALGQWAAAGEQFLLLARAESSETLPETLPACIPLAWTPSQPSGQLEAAARRWIARDDLPAAVLLGASHLMSIDRPAALARLKRLAAGAEGPIAQLARAQIRRSEVVTADEARLAAWSRAIERMPEPLRAGPYFVLGRGWAQCGQWDEAAIAMLRIPILYPRERHLAARALLEAGRCLEKLHRPGKAARLYRELIQTHPHSAAAAEARKRLGELMIDD